ncbi:hypothetical protein RND81_14G165900 [Saponaria officinalis]|uniref:SWIM-type domain-containing protein n=1 Tax=Saponaria officinalis TaxID=3572 RepID=A0AAW1GN76_SAPOF
MTSNVIPSTPLTQTAIVEKHTPPILLSYSPKGSQQWIRKVEEEFMPRVGMEFNTLEDGIQFYRIYAIACGFDIRKSSQRRFRDQIIRTKHIVYHREGYGESKKMKKLVNTEADETSKGKSDNNKGNSDNKKERVTTIRRFGCTSMIKLMFQSGKYGFQYAYHVDEGRNLSRVFWTDAHGKSAYLAFGDGVSFDQTYGTNKYCMVFTPFTGIDNHKKSVTFACALLSNEDEESFVWVFKNSDCFKTAKHRFCLWHIMNKVADKIYIITLKETYFLSRLNGVVWNQDLEPTEFEIKWNEVITEFGLDDNRWLSTMFDIKEYWILAYFRDMSKGNIMSTTQRSESENSFFKKFENHYGTLVEFWLRYESAMDQQRHTHKRLEMESNNSIPKTITPLNLESHALTVYTHEVFYEIREEIKSSMCGCGIFGDILCTCKLFERRGLICRHIFWVFSNKLLKTIPEKYILTLWSKNALRGPIYDLNENIIENYDAADESQLEMSKVWSGFYNVISVVAKKEADVLRDLQWVLREFKDTVEPAKEKMSKRQEMEMLIGCSTPDEVRILPPRHSKNKGSGKRIVTSKNMAIEKENKQKRRTLSRDHIKALAASLKTFREEIGTTSEALSKDKEIEQLLGCTSSSEVTILPPRFSKNKGSGKTLLSNMKDSIAKAQKPKRLCAYCEQMANHEKRNCPQKETDIHTNDVFSLTF